MTLQRPSVWKNRYELRAGEEIVATLGFPNVFNQELKVEENGECWVYRQKGIFKRVVLVRECSADKPFVTIPLEQSRGVYKLKLPHYRSVRLKVNIWKSEYILTTTMNAVLCTLKLNQFPRFTGDITVARDGEALNEHPWLLYLVLFVALTNQQHKA